MQHVSICFEKGVRDIVPLAVRSWLNSTSPGVHGVFCSSSVQFDGFPPFQGVLDAARAQRASSFQNIAISRIFFRGSRRFSAHF